MTMKLLLLTLCALATLALVKSLPSADSNDDQAAESYLDEYGFAQYSQPEPYKKRVTRTIGNVAISVTEDENKRNNYCPNCHIQNFGNGKGNKNHFRIKPRVPRPF